MPFDAEAYFDSKIRNATVRDQGVVLDFSDKPLPSRNPPEKGIHRIIKENFKYNEFKRINEFHTEYLRDLKGNLHPSAFMEVLYRAELTGAKVRVWNNKCANKCENVSSGNNSPGNNIGFIISERKNSIIVIYKNDKIKVFPKSAWNFSLIFDEIEYIFFASDMKKNRYLK